MTQCALRIIVLALVILGVACSGKRESEPDAAANKASASAEAADAVQAADSLPRQLEKLGALVELVGQEAAALPRAEFEPAALVAAIGRVPQRLYERVRDRAYRAPISRSVARRNQFNFAA